MKAFLLALVPTALLVKANDMFAFTTGSGGYPVTEASDTQAMLSGVGQASTGALNFIVDNWTVLAAIFAVGAIIAFVRSVIGRSKAAVRGH